MSPFLVNHGQVLLMESAYPSVIEEYGLGGGQMGSIAGPPCLLAFLYIVFLFLFKLSWNKKKRKENRREGKKRK